MSVKWFGDDVAKQIKAAMKSGVDSSLEPIARDARSKARVDTGRLKASIKIVAAEADGDEIFGMVIADVDYAVFEELKTRFLRRSLSENEGLKNFEGRLK